jgi:three-Cys-motif partner protein
MSGGNKTGDSDFFDNSTERSKIKTEIVSRYFKIWANIILNSTHGKVAYIDLYCGPGLYNDGHKSTPVRILENALESPKARERLVILFNDKEKSHIDSLNDIISKIPDIGNLKNKPDVRNLTIGAEIVASLKGVNLIPTLLFVDPFGYKGLSIALIGSVLKDWGCDCIFFFNYNRINAAISNPVMKSHVDNLFGEDMANYLREKIVGLKPFEREQIVMETLKVALKKIQGNYVVTFKFYDNKGTKTSHFLIFVSKNAKAYKEMKGVMHNLSTGTIDNVALYEFKPVVLKEQEDKQLALFGANSYRRSPLDILEKDLLERYQGKTITMNEIFESHNVNTPYIERNYKDVLLNLERNQKIVTNPAAAQRRPYNGQPSFAGTVTVTFPTI